MCCTRPARTRRCRCGACRPARRSRSSITMRPIAALALSKDGTLIAAAGREIGQGVEQRRRQTGRRLVDARRRARHRAVAGQDPPRPCRQPTSWPASTNSTAGSSRRSPHDGPVQAAAFVDAKRVVTAAADKSARLWTSPLVWQQPHAGPARQRRLHAQGRPGRLAPATTRRSASGTPPTARRSRPSPTPRDGHAAWHLGRRRTDRHRRCRQDRQSLDARRRQGGRRPGHYRRRAGAGIQPQRPARRRRRRQGRHDPRLRCCARQRGADVRRSRRPGALARVPAGQPHAGDRVARQDGPSARRGRARRTARASGRPGTPADAQQRHAASDRGRRQDRQAVGPGQARACSRRSARSPSRSRRSRSARITRKSAAACRQGGQGLERRRRQGNCEPRASGRRAVRGVQRGQDAHRHRRRGQANPPVGDRHRPGAAILRTARRGRGGGRGAVGGRGRRGGQGRPHRDSRRLPASSPPMPGRCTRSRCCRRTRTC